MPELPPDPDPEAEGVAVRVILLADVREVDVPDRVLAVEHDQQPTVGDREPPSHSSAPRCTLMA